MMLGKKTGLVALPSQYENVTAINTTRLLGWKILNLHGILYMITSKNNSA